MARLALTLGGVLVVLGVVLYLGSGRESVTALIPAFLGVALGACGLWARSPSRRKLAMHVAVVVAFLGAAGSARGLAGAAEILTGGTAERPLAVWGQTATFLLCLLFVVLAVRSFILARRNPGAPSESPPA